MAYQFRGKAYLSVNGLLNALKKDSGGATSFSMVINNQIRAFADDRKTVLVTYDVTPPVYGQLQVVTRAAAKVVVHPAPCAVFARRDSENSLEAPEAGLLSNLPHDA